eukprot:2628846-Rhodomonas_salina.1
MELSKLKCCFGTTAQFPVAMTKSEMICVAPPSFLFEQKLNVFLCWDRLRVSNSLQLDVGNSLSLSWRLHPSTGNDNGGTQVVIRGLASETAASTDAAMVGMRVDRCRFGQTEVAALPVAEDGSSIVCMTPPRVHTRVVSVHLLVPGLNGNILSVGTFEYHGELLLTSIYPTIGEANSPLTITIMGTRFESSVSVDANGYMVRFGKEIYFSNHATKTALLVFIPNPRPGNTTIEVSRNGMDFSNALPFLAVPAQDAVLSHIRPQWGGPEGGTAVTVSLLHMMPQFRIFDRCTCIYGAKTSLATWIDNRTALCYSPAHRSEQQEAVPFCFRCDKVRSECRTSTVLFHYTNNLRDIAIDPSFGAMLGGTVVTIRGTNPMLTFESACMFGTNTSILLQSSRTHVVCLSPPSPTSNAKPVSVIIAFDGFQHEFGEATFQYEPAATVYSLLPQQQALWKDTAVTVLGRHFSNTPQLVCRAGAA